MESNTLAIMISVVDPYGVIIYELQLSIKLPTHCGDWRRGCSSVEHRSPNARSRPNGRRTKKAEEEAEKRAEMTLERRLRN